MNAMDEWGPVNVAMLYDHDRTRLRVPLTYSSSTTFILLPDNAQEDLLVLENVSD